MLSPLDDLPIHQVAQPVRQPGTSDRNFYDRYYFNCHPCSDELFLVMGMGQYPNLGVQDAFALVRRGDEHRVVRASRELGLDRLDTSVGPFRVEVIEGLKTLRCTLDAPEHGLSYDLTWTGYVPAFQEPRPRRPQRQRPRLPRRLPPRAARLVVRHRSRSTASPTTSPPTTGGGAATARGASARSASPRRPATWPPSRPSRSAGSTRRSAWRTTRWCFICQERGDGSRVLEEAVRLWPDGGVDHLGRPEHDLQWNAAGPGLFGIVEKGTHPPRRPRGDGRAGAPGPHRCRHRLRLRRRRLEARRLPGRAGGPGQGLGPAAPTRAEAPCSASSTPSPGSRPTARPAGASSSGCTSDARAQGAPAVELAAESSRCPGQARSLTLDVEHGVGALAPTHHCRVVEERLARGV